MFLREPNEEVAVDSRGSTGSPRRRLPGTRPHLGRRDVARPRAISRAVMAPAVRQAPPSRRMIRPPASLEDGSRNPARSVHVSPPSGERYGPGSFVPAEIASSVASSDYPSLSPVGRPGPPTTRPRTDETRRSPSARRRSTGRRIAGGSLPAPVESASTSSGSNGTSSTRNGSSSVPMRSAIGDRGGASHTGLWPADENG